MGYRIFAPEPESRPPMGTALALACDGKNLLCEPQRVFDDPAGYIEQRRQASHAGWLIRPAEKGRGYEVLGPCCSGKKMKGNDDE